MNIAKMFTDAVLVSCPPPGSYNIRVGGAVEGPGGRWIPCASAIAKGAYLPSIYEVGPGRRQVCAAIRPSDSVDEALFYAVELAMTAAA